MTSIARVSRLLMAGACLAAIAPAMAQDDGTSGTAVAAETTGRNSEEITVTATRRATNIQKTPIAITAVGQKAIENAGIRDTQSLTSVVPALQFPQSENSASVTARIRGVGTQGSNPGLESAVGVFIDGVYRSRNSVAFGDLGDLQRVEVLRGPQGTLFGRNTSAGLISVITQQPSLTEVQGSASATYESFNGFYLTGGLSAPIVQDELGVRIFGSLRQRDGYVDVNPDIPGERDGNNKDSWALRGQLLWAPDEDTTVRFIADASRKDEECCYGATLRPGGPGRAGGTAGLSVPDTINKLLGYRGKASRNTIEDQIAYADRSYDQTIEEWGVSAEINSDLGWGTLTSVTAYREWDYVYGQDADFSALDIIHLDPDGSNSQGFKTFTQEFRLAGETELVDWLVGGFYSHEQLNRSASVISGSAIESFLTTYRVNDNPFFLRGVLAALLPGGYNGANALTSPVWQPGGRNLDTYEQTAESIALFTHNVFHVTDDFDVTLGLRWTTETKEFSADYNNVNGVPGRLTGCEAIEAVYGLNPLANPALPNPSTLRALVPLICLPGSRGALDALTPGDVRHLQDRDEDEFSGIVTLSYEATEDINLYATYSRGYKAGGFNLDRSYTLTATDSTSIVSGPVGAQTIVGPDTSFPAEFVDAYEIGGKFSFFDGEVQLNLAAYYQDFEDYQLNTFSGISFFVTSVPEVISKGVEVDLNWNPDIEGLTLNAGISYNSAKYGDDEDMEAFVLANPSLFFLPGENLTNAPDWTLTGAITYEFGVGDEWMGLIHVDGRYVTEQRTGSNLDPAKTQEAYGIVNLRLGIGLEDESFTLEFWARNLFDKRYFQITFDSPLQGSSPSALRPEPLDFSQIDAFLGEPLTVGITARTRF